MLSVESREEMDYGTDYSIYSLFPCEIYLDGKKHSECCCKLEAKDNWFSLVHLLGYPKDKIKIISSENGEEVKL